MTKEILYSSLPDNTFSPTCIFETAAAIEPAFKKTQMNFYINQMIENNMIVRTGYGTYVKNIDRKPVFSCTPSEEAGKIAEFLKDNYPLVKFARFFMEILLKFIIFFSLNFPRNTIQNTGAPVYIYFLPHILNVFDFSENLKL